MVDGLRSAEIDPSGARVLAIGEGGFALFPLASEHYVRVLCRAMPAVVLEAGRADAPDIGAQKRAAA